MCLWSWIIVESEHTLTCAKCTSSGVRWIICGCGMWFLLSNVVCNGSPCYLESGSASEACENGDRRTQLLKIWAWVLGVWAQILPLVHIIHVCFSTANSSENYCDCMSFCSRGGHRGQRSAGDRYAFPMGQEIIANVGKGFLFCSFCRDCVRGIDFGCSCYFAQPLYVCVQVRATQSPPRPHKSSPGIPLFSRMRKISTFSRAFPPCGSFLSTAHSTTTKKKHEMTWFAAFYYFQIWWSVAIILVHHKDERFIWWMKSLVFRWS